MSEPIAFSPAQAAAVTGLPVDTIVAAAMDGRLKAHSAGSHVVVLRTDLERFIACLPRASSQSNAKSAADIAAALSRGKAIALKALGPAAPEPARQRGREIAERLLKNRKG